MAQQQNQHIEPKTTAIYTSSVYTFPDLDSVRDFYAGNPENRYLYRRNGHPNERPVEAVIANLEQAGAATLTASGMAAIASTCFALLRPGDHLICTDRLYGGTAAFFNHVLRDFGIDVDYCDVSDTTAVQNHIRSNTAMIYAETIANPLLEVADLLALGSITKEHDLTLVVDNTFATPLLTKPLTLGATVTLHSLTKYLNGHSDVIGGAIAADIDTIERIRSFAVTFGATLAPFDAWLTERGVATFALRFRQQCDNAQQVAQYLRECPQITRVYYPGLPSHGTHETATRVLTAGFGAMVSFELDGGYDAANRFVQDAAGGIPFAPSLGGVVTSLSHPQLTSHRALAADEQARQGITPGLLRLSVGVEPIEDILHHLASAWH